MKKLIPLIALLLSGCYAGGGGYYQQPAYNPSLDYVQRQQAYQQYLWQQQMMQQSQPRRTTICNTFPGQVQCY